MFAYQQTQLGQETITLANTIQNYYVLYRVYKGVKT
jgi:hypothetical protein